LGAVWRAIGVVSRAQKELASSSFVLTGGFLVNVRCEPKVPSFEPLLVATLVAFIHVAKMSEKHPRLELKRLREIGWSLWDPIGLDGNSGIWREETFADEYDAYLIKAAVMLRNQCALAEVVEYLFFIETDYMGLGVETSESEIRENLLKVTQAINDDPLIWSDGISADTSL
jgi:hypothetical protein